MQKTVSMTYTAFDAPIGTVVEKTRLSFATSGQPTYVLEVPTGEPSTSIDMLAGTYTLTAQSISSSGASVGPAAITTFVIEGPTTVSVQIIGGLSVS